MEKSHSGLTPVVLSLPRNNEELKKKEEASRKSQHDSKECQPTLNGDGQMNEPHLLPFRELDPVSDPNQVEAAGIEPASWNKVLTASTSLSAPLLSGSRLRRSSPNYRSHHVDSP
jgi:hypothetical protein